MGKIKEHVILGVQVDEYEKSLVVGAGGVIQTSDKEQALKALKAFGNQLLSKTAREIEENALQRMERHFSSIIRNKI